MSSSKNRELLVAAFARFGRAALAAVAALIIPQLLELIPQLELGPEFKAGFAILLAPALLALDKYARGRRLY